VKMSELISAYGDDKVEFQNLDQCTLSLNANTKGTKLTFGTEQSFDLKGTKKLGLVIWLDRVRVKEIIEAGRSALQGGEK
jgi:hypothetical protein